ncbi:NDP-sugar epimerase, includes UDP-GlcNAc-inverting 4,6-dehydratase FlaA1 and capsular polysaccharide biosynthesis protein EpsC [Bacillus sp. 491mf]|uniref:polysaccharide biosynthesis protein n=1 Tax=Bacillus sp. 491mf TaxID=1761755 RepID=UPI0008F18470|nr:nucleoside-diphosphate sugar epimerase/dehydratase [Bacillus sp. 491mf]SFC99484.1 NDP-sugar epimerase, includes UDP-GlcNAc-inverting 4,6-dehydratase FlaA1 and capsular polysaccharide biosynthesis protein EpsC [Bacillus sp. 491mf]
MTYRQRLSLLLLTDSLIVLSAIYFSYFFVNGSFRVITLTSVVSSITLLCSHHFFAFIYKLYKKAWEYASIGELLIIFKAITFSIATTALVQQLVIHEVYFRLLAITWMIHVLLIGGSRFIWRMLRDAYFKRDDTKKRTLIIGAGSAGTMVTRQLLQNNETELLPVAFIDDNVKKHNLDILGIPVIGGVNQIESVVQELNIDSIVIAIPSLSKKGLNAIFKECSKTKAKTQILPMLEDLVTGKVSVNEFRDVQVEDLLGRSPIELDMNSISEYITDKVILVTGAGGSIGSEICRQVAKFNPKQLILLGHGENSIYSIEMELRELYGNMEITFIPEIADIQDSKKMMLVMNKYRPNVVYHAAAHKHVPLMEYNPEEAVKNNLMGTMNVAQAASWHDVETFVMISSDKAVNPTNVMGATKRLAEMIVQHTNKMSQTKFVAVRFGNVLGSRGSVIPLFKKQIQKGGPVTVTHPDMVRYFMTIPEASRLVIQAGALAEGGEIFVLDMGEPVKIVDLAKNLIKLSGNSVEEIGIEFTGMRPGEKLFEELLKDDEMIEQQIYPRIYVGKETNIYIEEIEKIISTHSDLDKEELRNILLDLANRHNASKVLTPALG